jgi:hypothetical protein
MIKLFASLAFFFLVQTCLAQETMFRPITYKEAPAEAVNYLKTQKLKAKKAKWSISPTGVYLADFQKKKQSTAAYYLRNNGVLMYKRTPIQLSELPVNLAELMGDRMKDSGALLHIYKSPYNAIYSISIPANDGSFITKYFTSDGTSTELSFK